MSGADTVRVLGSSEGTVGLLASIGVRFMLSNDDTSGGFSLVEHPMPARALGAPLHRHSREDEYSYVLEGRVGALLGQELVYAETGDLILKPRDEWHTFWNAGDEPARILEIISPAGFEQYFREMVALAPDAAPQARAEIAARFELEVDPASIPRLVSEHSLTWGRRG